MKVLPYLAIFTFVAGLGMLGMGYFYSGQNESNAQSRPVETFDLLRTSTPTEPPSVATELPSATPTNAPTATPTPVPFNGKVGRLEIARLGISNAIEEIGFVGTTNELDTPHDAINKVGWYHIYDKPGFHGDGVLGNAVFSAHVNYNFQNGPFAKLQDVKADDMIAVQMDGGPLYTYRVFRKQRYDVETIPMGDLIWPKDKPPDKEWITLITCGGRFVATQPNGLGEYRDRDVVVAERIS
ncbi:MAG: sortase [Tepidiformaceae bacterium]